MTPPGPRLPESALRAPVRRFLEAEGYRVWVAPDGRDYLDLVARRGDRVGLVELKVADWRTVRAQAVVRRTLADWVAVVLPRRTLADRLVASLRGPVAPRMGVWVSDGSQVEVVRAAIDLEPPPEGTPAADARRRFRALLDAVDGLPEGVAWGGSARRTGGGRRYRLDEFGDGAPESSRTTSSATRPGA